MENGRAQFGGHISVVLVKRLLAQTVSMVRLDGDTDRLCKVTLTGLATRWNVDCVGKIIVWLTAGSKCLFLGWRTLGELVDCGGVRKSSL